MTAKRRSKRSTVKAEDVRIVSDNGGIGVEGMALGPKATAALRKARAKARRDKN